MRGEPYTRQLKVNSELFDFEGEITIADTVENPESLADEIEDGISDSLLEVIVLDEID